MNEQQTSMNEEMKEMLKGYSKTAHEDAIETTLKERDEYWKHIINECLPQKDEMMREAFEYTQLLKFLSNLKEKGIDLTT